MITASLMKGLRESNVMSQFKTKKVMLLATIYIKIVAEKDKEHI